jgi:ribose 5-phosphate isomerase B
MPEIAPQNTIAIAGDHGAVELKAFLKEHLAGQGFTVLDLGTHGTESVDYPDFGNALAKALADGKAERGVLLCGSGIGISIAANRHSHIRCALVSEPLTARLCREHNDANVIAFGARLIGPEMAKECLNVFLATAFEGGRHARRVDKLANPPAC